MSSVRPNAVAPTSRQLDRPCAVRCLRNPTQFAEPVKQSGAQGAGDMVPSLRPVEAAARNAVTAGGEPRPLQRMADSGRLNTRFVCPDCACWIYSLPRDGVIRVRAGTLDDTTWLRPTRHIWTRSKQPWITFAEGGETFEGQPPS